MQRTQTQVLIKILSTVFLMILAGCRGNSPSLAAAEPALANRTGTLVLVDCDSGEMTVHGREFADTRLAPCSTFKIVNSLIGLEEGILSAPDEAFYEWDGVERSFAGWNRDLTLREAFQVSCVPAYQQLARRIGADRMRNWIGKIGYGNEDTSAGIDVFWLPKKDRATILISPTEQAVLMKRIATGELPCSEPSLAVLKQLMLVKETGKGRLYGKTGSGANEQGAYVLGWFVGYVESGGRTYAFACMAQGENFMGKDARAIVERVLADQDLL